jgi:hypothetical protein
MTSVVGGIEVLARDGVSMKLWASFHLGRNRDALLRLRHGDDRLIENVSFGSFAVLPRNTAIATITRRTAAPHRPTGARDARSEHGASPSKDGDWS